MAWHAQLKFVMTDCSKTQIRLTGLSYNKACQYVTQYNTKQGKLNFGKKKIFFQLSYQVNFGYEMI